MAAIDQVRILKLKPPLLEPFQMIGRVAIVAVEKADNVACCCCKAGKNRGELPVVVGEDSGDARIVGSIPLDDLARPVRAGIRDDDLIGRPRLNQGAFQRLTNEFRGIEAINNYRNWCFHL